MKRLLVLLCLAAVPAYAFPDLKGKIVNAGSSVNNLTTAVPFQLPQGNVSVLCNAAAYLTVGLAGTVSTTDGLPLAANVEKAFALAGGRGVIAILPVAGPVTCRVWLLYGDTIAYRPSGDGNSSASALAATRDYSAHTFVCQAGNGEQCMSALHNGARWYVGPNVRMYGENARLIIENTVALGSGQSLQADQLATASNTKLTIFNPTYGIKIWPSSSAPTGTCGENGCFYVNSTTGQLFFLAGFRQRLSCARLGAASMIGFIGDSLMRGISMPEAFGQPYPALWADATGSGIQNFGLGGDCSGAESSVYVGGAKQRLIDRVLPYGYEDGIAVGLGANDVLQGVSAATMLTNVADMIASCIAYGVRAIVLFEVTPQDAANGAQNTKIATINAGLATLATAHPGYVSVAPLHASEADATKLTPAFTNDGLHFTAAGHIAAAAALETANIFGRTV